MSQVSQESHMSQVTQVSQATQVTEVSQVPGKSRFPILEFGRGSRVDTTFGIHTLLHLKGLEEDLRFSLGLEALGIPGIN